MMLRKVDAAPGPARRPSQDNNDNNKTSGGNHMSMIKRATRRLSLLAGSSLVVAGIAAAAAVSVTAAPTFAYAADECVPANAPVTQTDGPDGVSDPTLNGAVADNFTCAANDYAGGITYSSDGVLTVQTTGAATMTTNAAGVNLTGNGADNVTFTAGRAITATSGPAIDVASGTGAITVATTAAITANTGTASHAIRAISGGGAITVTTGTGAINANSNTVPAGLAAIEARSTAGNGAVTVTTGTGAVTGRLRGIFAQASGSGALTITTGGNVGVNTVVTNGGIGQVAAIDAISGTGAATININAGTVAGAAGSAVRVNAGGATTLNIAAAGTLTAGLGTSADDATPVNWVVDINSAGLTTLNNAGSIRSTVNSSRGYDDRAIRVAGAGRVVVNNTGRIAGRVDFSNVAFVGAQPSVTFNVTGATAAWFADGLNQFSAGADVLATSAGGSINVATGYFANGSTFAPPTTFDFGAGNDVFNNGGILQLGADAAGTLTFVGLETFNNSGLITLGDGEDITDDRLVAHGITFNGLAGGALQLEVNFEGPVGAQMNCSVAVVADCLDLAGSTITGQTPVMIRGAFDPGTLPPSHYNPGGVVLVDVSGGTVAADAFVLSPASDHYVVDPILGGVIERQGLFFYDIAYDDATQRFLLVGLPRPETLQLPTVAAVAQDIWRTATGTVFDRQAGLRSGNGGEGGVWLRGSADFGERELTQGFDSYGTSYAFDASYEQRTFTLMAGVDLLADADADRAYGFGVMLGYVNSEAEFQASPTLVKAQGGTLGAYLSYDHAGGFWLDAVAQGTVVLMDQDIPGLNLPSGTLSTRTVQSFGGQAEAGWRKDVGAGLYVEPLVAVSYVRTSFDQFEFPGSRVDFDEAVSLRGGLGARVGGDGDAGSLSIGWMITGRYWNEFEGENGLTVESDGPLLQLVDDFAGAFGDLSAGLTLGDASGGFSGFVDAGLKFGEDYKSTDISAGVRFRW
jgi:hypothetical protein